MYTRLRPVNNSYTNDNNNWMIGGDEFLIKNNISKSTPIVTMGVASPNLGLIYFDRKGIHFAIEISGPGGWIIEQMKEYKVTYVVASKKTIEYIEDRQYCFSENFDLIAEDGEKLLYKLR